MKDLSANFERHEAGPGIGLLKGLGVKLEGGKFSCEDPEDVSKKIAEREDFIQSPTMESPLLEHFKGRKESHRNRRSSYRIKNLEDNL